MAARIGLSRRPNEIKSNFSATWIILNKTEEGGYYYKTPIKYKNKYSNSYYTLRTLVGVSRFL